MVIGNITDLELGSSFARDYRHSAGTLGVFLYAACQPLLARLPLPQRRLKELDAEQGSAEEVDVIVFGLGRYGGTIGRRLVAEGYRVLGVDFSPEAVRRWQGDGLQAVFGDISDPEVVKTLQLRKPKWIIAAVPDPNTGVSLHDSRLALLRTLRDGAYSGSVAVATHAEDEHILRQAGADVVLEPHADAADRAVGLLLARGIAGRGKVEKEPQRAL